MENIKQKLESKKRAFSSIFFFSISIIFFLYYLTTKFFDKQRELLNNVTEYYLIVSIVAAFFGILISKLAFNFVSFYRILLGLIIMFICYNTLLHCHLSFVAYFFFIPLITFVSILYDKKMTFFIAFLFILFIVISKPLALILEISRPISIPKNLENTDELNKIVITSLTSYFTFFFVYHKKQFEKIQAIYDNYLITNNKPKDTINVLQEHHKFEILFDKIQKAMINEKVYQDPNFTKTKLAELLDTNETYISKAISLNGKRNFKYLINQYRIEQVKAELSSKKFEKFTIEHIYTKAGFAQQSTFNRVFKDFTGSTPSEYIESLKKDNDY